MHFPKISNVRTAQRNITGWECQGWNVDPATIKADEDIRPSAAQDLHAEGHGFRRAYEINNSSRTCHRELGDPGAGILAFGVDGVVGTGFARGA